MKSVLALFLLFSVNLAAQEYATKENTSELASNPTQRIPQQTADLRLSRTEQIEWENIQLKGGNIKRQIADMEAAMKQLEAQLADLNKRVLEVRKLDSKEYAPNWQASPAVVAKLKPPEAAQGVKKP